MCAKVLSCCISTSEQTFQCVQFENKLPENFLKGTDSFSVSGEET